MKTLVNSLERSGEVNSTKFIKTKSHVFEYVGEYLI